MTASTRGWPGEPTISLADSAAVLDATRWDAYARNTIRPPAYPTRGWRQGAAVAWLGLDAEERTPVLSVLGPAAPAASLVADIVDLVPAGTPLTIGPDVAAVLASTLGFERRFHWLFRTMSAAPAVSADVAIRVLPAGGDDRVIQLLHTDGGTFSAWPGDPAVNRWVVVEAGDEIVACVADTSGAAGVGHMGSVVVQPAARGRGVGRAVVSWLTADLLAHGCDVVAVGVFVEARPAQRLYDSLGFRTDHEFVSRPVTVGTTPDVRPAGPTPDVRPADPSRPPGR